MERLDLDDAEVEARRAALLAVFAQEPETAEPEDHPAREELCPGSLLALYDDVETADGRWRIIAPAAGRTRVSVFGVGPFGPTSTSISVHDIVERAPADLEAVPMPVLGEVEPLPAEGPPPVFEFPPPDIEALRLDVIKQVDIVSTALIRRGFEFEGIIFSMTNEAQIRYLGMQADADFLPYPLPINSKDDSTFLVLYSAEHTLNFCRGAKLHVMSVVGTGTLQKQAVRSMQTAAELSAYHDPRAEAVSNEQLELAEQELTASRPGAL